MADRGRLRDTRPHNRRTEDRSAEYDEDEFDEYDEEPDEGDEEEDEANSARTGEDLSLAEIAEATLRQIAEITTKSPAGVTSVEPAEDGWVVGVELIEEGRVPSSADILALYEAEVGTDGALMSYRRTRRYPRGRGDDNGTG